MGYISLGLCAGIIIIGFLTCCCPAVGIMCAGCYMILLVFISVFNLIWIIIGAVMFWGELYPKNACNPSISAYMFARLIIVLIGACCNLFTSRSSSVQRIE